MKQNKCPHCGSSAEIRVSLLAEHLRAADRVNYDLRAARKTDTMVIVVLGALLIVITTAHLFR